jgi:hypothetical protein
MTWMRHYGRYARHSPSLDRFDGLGLERLAARYDQAVATPVTAKSMMHDEIDHPMTLSSSENAAMVDSSTTADLNFERPYHKRMLHENDREWKMNRH